LEVAIVSDGLEIAANQEQVYLVFFCVSRFYVTVYCVELPMTAAFHCNLHSFADVASKRTCGKSQLTDNGATVEKGDDHLMLHKTRVGGRALNESLGFGEYRILVSATKIGRVPLQSVCECEGRVRIDALVPYQLNQWNQR